MPTREEAPTYRTFVDYVFGNDYTTGNDYTAVNDYGTRIVYAGDVIETPSIGESARPILERNLWDEEWESGVYVDANGEAHGDVLVSRHYIPISPEYTYGFTVRTPHKNSVFHFYDRHHNEIGRTTLAQGVDTEVVPPEHAHYMKFMIEGYGKVYNNDIFMTLTLKKDSLPLSEESINNFESFLGGQI